MNAIETAEAKLKSTKDNLIKSTKGLPRKERILKLFNEGLTQDEISKGTGAKVGEINFIIEKEFNC